jgi:hypothetical protein
MFMGIMNSPSGCSAEVRTLLKLLYALAAAGSLFAQPTADQLEFFEKKIRPVLTEKCYACHNAKLKRIRPMGPARQPGRRTPHEFEGGGQADCGLLKDQATNSDITLSRTKFMCTICMPRCCTCSASTISD